MVATELKELLEAGAHFGHQTQKWNPKMKQYIFDSRNGIHILNLEMTVGLLSEACAFVTSLFSRGQRILLVGTKNQAKEEVVKIADELGMPYVAERWLGGMLTNLSTIRKSIEKLEKYEAMEADGTMESLSKKEQSMLQKEKSKLTKYLTGVKNMNTLPDALLIIDPKKEAIAVSEAKKLNLPIIAVLDTNCDPDLIDFPVPANDDSMRTVQYVLGRVKDAALQGKEVWTKNEELRLAKEAEEKALEEKRKEELRKKMEKEKKAKEEAEAAQKAKADEIIADLEKNKSK